MSDSRNSFFNKHPLISLVGLVVTAGLIWSLYQYVETSRQEQEIADLGPPAIGEKVEVPLLSVDVNQVLDIDADSYIRPGVVGYGLGSGGDPSLETFNQYLDATKTTVGDIVISTLGVELRKLTALSGSTAFNMQLKGLLKESFGTVIDAIEDREVGARVQFAVFCGLPDHLSLYPGVPHDVQSGYASGTEHPISACAPIDPSPELLDNGKTRQEEWAAIMRTVAAYYRRNDVYFVVGSEPTNYFAGDFEQYLAFSDYTIKGLRQGNPKVEIGILNNPSLQENKMLRANPVRVREGSAWRVKMTPVEYETTLLEMYLKHIHDNRLEKVDAIQYRSFNKSPFPANTAFWRGDAEYIDNIIKGLGPENHVTNGPVTLMVTDYPHWHTKCAADLDNIGEWTDGESIWDSEYLAALYTSAYLGMLDFSHENQLTGEFENIKMVEPHLAFLVNWGEDTFFHTTCEMDNSSPGGFGGAIALNAKLTGIPKPISHVLKILDGFEGKLMQVDFDDQNLFAYGSYRAEDEQHRESLTLVLSQFVPTEVQVSTFKQIKGEPAHEFGDLLNNDYGADPKGYKVCADSNCQDPRQVCCTSDAFKSMVYDPDGRFPRNMIKALLVDGADPNDWGLPEALVKRFQGVKQAGKANRQLPVKRDIGFIAKGLAPSTEYVASINTIDDVTGNAYHDRYAIDEGIREDIQLCRNQLCSRWSGQQLKTCMKRCVLPRVEHVRSKYLYNSTSTQRNIPVWSDDKGELYLTLPRVRKNSVHLLKLVKRS